MKDSQGVVAWTEKLWVGLLLWLGRSELKLILLLCQHSCNVSANEGFCQGRVRCFVVWCIGLSDVVLLEGLGRNGFAYSWTSSWYVRRAVC